MDRCDEACGGCGATPEDRANPGNYLGLLICQFCDSDKCCMCDMGDDVECGNCPDDD